MVESIDTSGRAVLFAGMIVCIAMLGMFALGVSFLYGVAIAASIAVAFTVLAALTLLPALLGFFGRYVLRRRERRAVKRRRAADQRRIARLGRAGPAGWPSARPCSRSSPPRCMIIIAIPFFSMRLGSADAGSDPANTTTRKAYDLLAKGFGPGYNGPLQLVAQINNPAQRAAFLRVQQAVARTPGVVGAAAPRFIPGTNGRPGVAIAEHLSEGLPTGRLDRGPAAHGPQRGRPRRRGAAPACTCSIGGQTAIFDDFSHVLSRKLPLFIGIVVLLSFLLLMAVFR